MKLRVESALGKPLAVRTTEGSVTSTSRTRSAPVARCPEQARGPVGGRRRHLAVDDPGVAESRASEQRVEPVEQRLVAAPVDVQRRPRAGARGGVEVGVDVGAAEGVDRLFGVADQDERRLSARRAAAPAGRRRTRG